MLEVDALVIGGAAAGLSAALVLGRARVPTLVVDAGAPSNRVAHAIGGLLGQDGTSPAAFYAAGRRQLEQHPAVRLREGTVVDARAEGDGFEATLADGTTVLARRVLLAGGMEYALPELEGLAALWGGAAFQCPYCHGWELRDSRIAILGADGAAHRVPLLRNWTADLVLLADGPLTDREGLDGVEVDERPLAAVAPGVARFADGGELRADAFHVIASQRPRDALADRLGIATEDSPLGSGFVVADRWGAPSDAGVFAAGDRVGAGNVAAAVARGNLAATGLHRSLLFA